MKIVCDNCEHEMQLPDEKVPNQAFSIACQGCQNRIVIDPTAGNAPTPMPAPAATAATGAAGATAATGAAGATAAAADAPSAPRMPVLRSSDLKLLEALVPIAFVANIDLPAEPEVTRQLQHMGMEEVREFSDLKDACEQLVESEAGIFLVRVPKATAPPFEALSPIYKMPFDVRRRTFVALMADNVKSLDGQVAFYLQVNCLLSARELDALAPKLRRALIYHLRLYRHWWDLEAV